MQFREAALFALKAKIHILKKILKVSPKERAYTWSDKKKISKTFNSLFFKIPYHAVVIHYKTIYIYEQTLYEAQVRSKEFPPWNCQ